MKILADRSRRMGVGRGQGPFDKYVGKPLWVRVYHINCFSNTKEPFWVKFYDRYVDYKGYLHYKIAMVTDNNYGDLPTWWRNSRAFYKKLNRYDKNSRDVIDMFVDGLQLIEPVEIYTDEEFFSNIRDEE